jgi:RND family efflux transporter MFP subunit
MINKASKDKQINQADEFWHSELEEDYTPSRSRDRGKFSGWKGVVIGLAIGAAITAAAGTQLPKISLPKKAETKPPQQVAPPTQTVTVAAAQTNPISRKLQTTGTIAARDLIPVLPQANGLQIKQILAEEGQEVKAQQVLAVLDDSVLRSQIDGAKADVASKQATVVQRQAALEQARATAADAQSKFERYETLANSGAISRQELETRSTTAATAREAVSSAQASITTAQADVRSSVARVQQLETQLTQTLVRAPASGIIAEKIAKIGDVSNPSQRFFTIISNGALELQAQVPETQLPQIRIDAPAEVTSDTDSRIRLEGRVRDIAPLVNAQSRQAIVKIDLPTTGFLRPGMFARAAITTNTSVAVTVPNKAVLPQADGSAIVFLLSGEDKVQARQVEVGEVVNTSNVEIKKGLQAGDRIVVAGAGYLKDGDRVRIASQ